MKMKILLSILGLVLITETLSTYIDVFETTNGHEPQVAINCGRVPFYIDLETGAWVSDSEGATQCDHKKKNVLKYCRNRYPSLNISNIVEANKPVKFNNWCKPGHAQCDETEKVVPYRCLVKEYEADALMVPQGCKFDHIYIEDMCLSHDIWKVQAAGACKRKHSMKLKDYGILLPCGIDVFTGVEYVCCPKKKHAKKHAKTGYNINDLSHAIKRFQKYLPAETKGCDRSTYISKQTTMEDHHRDQIAAVVDEWDQAEKRYNKLKADDPVAAEEKMKRTLEVFRTTLAALEQESKDEKSRLRAEHSECINTQISKNKHDAMVVYLASIEEVPVSAEKILKAVRKFIQVCEHDRVHSLRHFEHVRNRDPKKAETLRGELLQHLKDLNKVVNESMALLNYLPEIAEQFGITGGAILKPMTALPTDDHSAHDHDRVKEILESAKDKFDKSTATAEPQVPTDAPPMTELEPAKKVVTKESGVDKGDEDEEDIWDEDNEDEEEEKEPTKKKNEGVEFPKIVVLPEKTIEKRSPIAFNAVMGLSCGVFVTMLFLVVAMIIRRRRITRTRVVLAENNNDQEHLLQMQKSGFENPTYKFFYY